MTARCLSLVCVLSLFACVDPPTPQPKPNSESGADKAEPVGAAGTPTQPGYEGDPVATETRAGGLLVEDFVIGTGAEAMVGGEVSVHYTGMLDDGTVFDTSFKRNRPFTFTVGEGNVIKGWDQGVSGMKVGGKRRLVIPAELAYGPRKKSKIPANSRLTFTIELVEATPPLPPPKPESVFAAEPISKTELEGGLIVEDFAVGEGERVAAANDKLFVHYTGKLDDGTVFDSSIPRKKPIGFVLGTGGVIKGWDLGLAGMKVGGLRRLTIPAPLAYGERAKGKIPANSQLTFTVELMAIRDAGPQPSRPRLDSPSKPTPQ